LRVVREVVDNGAPISEVGRVFGIRVATIAEWVKRYRAGGIDALVPKPIVPRSGRRRWTLGATR
jgi:transposase-like protein